MIRSLGVAANADATKNCVGRRLPVAALPHRLNLYPPSDSGDTSGQEVTLLGSSGPK